jgi:hypothetical protein
MLAHEIDILLAPTQPPSLNICLSSSKARPEAMQEIQDNTSVDPCLDIPKESMWPYLTVPTYIMELLWNFSPRLGRLKGVTFCPCLSYLASFLNQLERITMILWFLNISHLGTFFGK